MASATAATTASGVALGGGAEDDARRTLNLCNVCGFCTGLCDVFAAAQRRPDLRAADLRHLAHLCHDCRSCFYDCQYAPPHRFAIGVPAALARVRLDHYGDPRLAGGLFWGAVVAVPAAMLLLVPGARLFAVHQGAGAFYAVLPHAVMSALAATGVALAGLWLAGRLGRFWLASAGPPVHWSWRVVARGVADAVVLRNLGGGRGPGCHDRLGRTDRWRRWSHHAVVTGVALTAAATLVAAVYHAGLGRVAPYPLTSPPVWLGTLGGVFMLGGLAGLARRRRHRDQAPDHGPMARADRALRGRLAWVAASGLVLLALRDTPAMGLMLALHLGSVLGLTLTVPISKLAHGAFRTAALIREAGERAARQRAARAGQGRVSKLGRAEAGGA
ncbi:hypothetical protein CKO24_11930 [Rhodothalassium salexigens DSM 2132]|nr:hypothetical protein [Rhodothalassium salexigens DSM 2132]